MGTRQDVVPGADRPKEELVVNLRNYAWTDYQALVNIFARQGLPVECLPEVMVKDRKNKLILNPRFVVKKVVEDGEGKIGMMGFVKVTSEAFLILDRQVRDPFWRWKALNEMVDHMAEEAKNKGLDCVTAWVPHNVVETFGPRLEALKFQRSPWVSYSRLL
jgi:hypothetical protein